MNFFVIDVWEIYYIVLLSHTEQNKLRFYHQVFEINILLLSQSNLRYFLPIKFLISMYLKYFPFYSYLTLINTSCVLLFRKLLHWYRFVFSLLHFTLISHFSNYLRVYQPYQCVRRPIHYIELSWTNYIKLHFYVWGRWAR